MDFILSPLSSSDPPTEAFVCSGSLHHDDSIGTSPSPAEIRFPFQVHDMLNDAQIRDFEDIVSWIPNENEVTSAFKVHDKTKFEKAILPKYFNTKKYRSFQRQLNLYRFARQDKKGEFGWCRLVLYC
jgi:hypothetical protein